MKRRSFIQKAGALGLGLAPQSLAHYQSGISSLPICVTTEENRIHYFSEAVEKPIKIILVADTHLFKDDERGVPFQQYSGRMAKAYNQTQHFQTGEFTNPEECFEQVLQHATVSGADLLVLAGDIFSWPSEAAIEWSLAQLDKVKIPYVYVAGNHDWHYEGMKGSLEELRATWIEKRLLPLYQGKNPLMASYDIQGIRWLVIDNSTYQISDEQLAFFRKQVASGLPLALTVHIPLYAPGKPVSFGCGHPSWGAASDKNFELERRPRWPEEGHTDTTINFYKEVFSAPNVLGIFAGHIHRSSMEFIKGKPQFVTDDNASGAFLDINFMPISEKDKTLYLQ